LVLVSRRHLRSNNTWLHNVPALMKGKDRCTLLMHPDDAASYGIADNDIVTVKSAAAEIKVPVEVTDAIKPGVVSMPHGWGHGKPGTRMSVANSSPGANTNVLSPPTVRVRVGPAVAGLGRGPGDAVADTEKIMAAIGALLPEEARQLREPTEEELTRTYPMGRVGEERAIGLAPVATARRAAGAKTAAAAVRTASVTRAPLRKASATKAPGAKAPGARTPGAKTAATKTAAARKTAAGKAPAARTSPPAGARRQGTARPPAARRPS